MATIEEFNQLDLKIGTIIEAEAVIETDKLLRLVIDLGQETRQIIAGLAAHYDPDHLIGTQVIIATGLETREIKGLNSQGMLLAASGPDDKPILLLPAEVVPDGTSIK